MKIGVEVRIDVTKIDKARLYKGEKGTYLTMTTFIDTDNVDQYDNNGFIAHKKDKDEQANPPILGNVKVFWSDGVQAQQQAPQQQQYKPQQATPAPGFQQPGMAVGGGIEEDIPFAPIGLQHKALLACI